MISGRLNNSGLLVSSKLVGLFSAVGCPLKEVTVNQPGVYESTGLPVALDSPFRFEWLTNRLFRSRESPFGVMCV